MLLILDGGDEFYHRVYGNNTRIVTVFARASKTKNLAGWLAGLDGSPEFS